MKSTRWRMMLCSLVLLAATTSSGCMAQRPHPYNRRSFHASEDRAPTSYVAKSQFARWHRKSDEQHVATATANSSKELSLDHLR